MEIRKLQELLDELSGKGEEYAEAFKSFENAQNAEAKAMFRLNETQKAVDDALLELRSSSPVGSAWCNGLKSKINEEEKKTIEKGGE